MSDHVAEKGQAVAPVAVVTGAAGGVGRAVVGHLVESGYRVVATDVVPAVRQLQAVHGERAVQSLVADVSASESACAAIDKALACFGSIDLLVNNAARFLRRPIEETSDEEFDALIATNVRGTFLHSRAAVPALRESKGSIVNVASTSGLVGVSGQSVYAMTKGAIVQHTRQLAIELAVDGVRVNAVAPGAIDTGFTAEARAADPDPEASARTSLTRHPLGRISTPVEVAEVVCFLAGPKASGMTGAIVSVDGGYIAQ